MFLHQNNYLKEIDLLKGIGIIYVVCGHLNPDFFLLSHIYSFHMFLFFFISGILLTKSSSFLPSFLPYMILKFKRLLYPYCFWMSVSCILSIYFFQYFPISYVNIFFFNGSVGWNSPLWFLVVIFETTIINFLFISYFKKIYYVIFAGVLLLSYIFIVNKIVLPFGLHIVPIGLVFQMLGNLVSGFNIKEKFCRLKKTKKIALCTILLFTNLSLTYSINGIISVYHIIYKSLFATYIAGIAGVFLYYFISIIYCCNKESKLIDFISLFGKNSLFILCTHYFFLKFIQLISIYLGGIDLWNWQNTIKSIVITVLLLLIYYMIFKYTNTIKNKYCWTKYIL